MYTRKHLTIAQAEGIYREALARLETELLVAHVNALMALDPARRAQFEADQAVTQAQVLAVEAELARTLRGEEAGHGGH